MASPAQPSMMKTAAAQERKWRAESDLRTLSEANDVRRDQKRLRDARRMARKQMTGLRQIAGKRR